jgi:broad specificity phosphatase PhoE
MTDVRMSLRAAIDKWVGRTSAHPILVVRHGHARSRRYVHVELSRSQPAHVMFFFRHDNGNWNVFPPETQRPVMTHLQYGPHDAR